MNDYCIYRHVRLDTNKVFYIGMSKTSRRPYDKRRNNIWHKITLKSKYVIEIIQNNLSWEDACELEEFLIFLYGRIDLKTGSLANLTNGGDGVIGYTQSKEQIEKRTLKNKGLKRIKEFCESLCLINSFPVINLETNKTFKNAKELSKLLKISHQYLCQMLRNERPNCTFYIYLKDIENKNIKINEKLKSPKRKVINIITNIIYNSVAEAALINNINKNTLSGYLKNKRPNKTNLRFYET